MAVNRAYSLYMALANNSVACGNYKGKRFEAEWKKMLPKDKLPYVQAAYEAISSEYLVAEPPVEPGGAKAIGFQMPQEGQEED